MVGYKRESYYPSWLGIPITVIRKGNIMQRSMNYISLAICIICLTACFAPQAFVATASPQMASMTPSRTASPQPNLLPTITSTPIINGAGLVAPIFDVQFHTRVENLPPDDYVIIRQEKDSTSKEYKYRYVNFHGDKSGDLLTISGPLTGYLQLDYSVGPLLGFDWLSENSSGMLFIDVKNQQINQFNPGCVKYFSPAIPQIRNSNGSYFAYSCDENSNRVWYIVSTKDWSITTYILPPASTTIFNYQFEWITNDLGLVWDQDRPDSSKNVCLVHISSESVTCLDRVPFWIEPTSLVSPDGKWVVAEYGASSLPDKLEAGIIRSDCFQNPQDNCQPNPISGFVISYSSGWENVYWSPDGSMVAAFDRYCVSPLNETKIWIYTLDTQKNILLGDYKYECYEPGPGPWTADGEHLLLIDKNSPDNWILWLISVNDGQLQRIAESYQNILDVVSLLEVP
jgi:hypothetical protein